MSSYGSQLEESPSMTVIGFDNSGCVGNPRPSSYALRKQRSLLSESLDSDGSSLSAEAAQLACDEGQQSVDHQDGNGSYQEKDMLDVNPFLEDATVHGGRACFCPVRSGAINIPWTRDIENKLKHAALARQRRASQLEDLQKARCYLAQQHGTRACNCGTCYTV